MNQISNILKTKCPNCGTGDIFSSKGNIFKFRMPRMHERCPHCNYKFEREIGFFFGAMFVSYALAAAEMIACMVIAWYFLDLRPLTVFFIIVAVAILSSTLNFRLSRTIWLYMFHKKEE